MKKQNPIPRIYSSNKETCFHTNIFNKLMENKGVQTKMFDNVSNYVPLDNEKMSKEREEKALSKYYKKLKKQDKTTFKGKKCVVVSNDKEEKVITLIEWDTDNIHRINY